MVKENVRDMLSHYAQGDPVPRLEPLSNIDTGPALELEGRITDDMYLVSGGRFLLVLTRKSEPEHQAKLQLFDLGIPGDSNRSASVRKVASAIVLEGYCRVRTRSRNEGRSVPIFHMRRVSRSEYRGSTYSYLPTQDQIDSRVFVHGEWEGGV